MRAWGAILDPPHMEHRAIEVDLVPAQVADLGRPEPMAEGHQDHGGVPVTVAGWPSQPRSGCRPRRASGARGSEARHSAAVSVQLFGKLQLARPAGVQNLSMKSPCPRGNCSYFTQSPNSRQAGKTHLSQTVAKTHCRLR